MWKLLGIFMGASVAVSFGLVVSDGRYLLDGLNRFVFPKGPAIVTDHTHTKWRQRTRDAAPRIHAEILRWEKVGHCFPEYTALTLPQYFPELDFETLGKPQQRNWGFLWLRLYGQETKLTTEFPELMALYDALPVEIYSMGISVLEPGRGDHTHFGEFRGTWRQLLTVETGGDERTVLGLYPYGEGKCDSIWLPPDRFHTECRDHMQPPRIHRYSENQDILFDDSVWHFIDNKSQKRRIAIWVDVVRTDLSFWQQNILRIFMFLASFANDEVTDIINMVNAINYKTHCEVSNNSSTLLDSAPSGPVEAYDPTLTIETSLPTYRPDDQN